MKKTVPESLEDLALLRRWGAKICLESRTEKEIVAFEHDRVCRDGVRLSVTFSGMCDHDPFSFSKTYARGHNPCCVKAAARALIIANTRLKRDYDDLEKTGVVFKRIMFNAAEAFPEMERAILSKNQPGAMEFAIRLARLGEPVHADMRLSYRPLADEKAPPRRMTASFTFFHGRHSYREERSFGTLKEGLPRAETAALFSSANRRIEAIRLQLLQTGIRINTAVFSMRDFETECVFPYVPLSSAEEKPLLNICN
ncbi:MAG: hypothetical protein AB1742_16015 [bacterium]